MDAEKLYDLMTGRISDDMELVNLTRHAPPPVVPYGPIGSGEQGVLKQRVFAGNRIDQEWGIASFTHLAFRGRAAGLPRDEGEIKKDESSKKISSEDRSPVTTIFDFPAGAVPGLCVHSIFERLDFSLSGRDDTRQLIDAALRQYGLDQTSSAGTSWNDVVYQMIRDVLQAPLLPHDARFTLGTLSRARIITELEFYYPVSRLSAGKIQAVLRDLAPEGDERLQAFADSSEHLEFRPVHGYMRGFIDLVFEHEGKYYLLDWKTNHLGYDIRDYDFPCLCRCVAEASYFLQYYIYTVALHRYLSLRLPDYNYDTHFGGVVYLFVRGVNPDIPGNGVYFDRPSAAVTDGLNQVLGQ